MYLFGTMRAFLLPALPAAALLAACSTPPAVSRDPGPLLQTEALSYELTEDDVGYRARIPYTFRNETGGPVYLVNCEGDVRPLLEMDRNGIWFPAWEPFGTGCQSPPVIVPEGGTYGDTLALRGARPGSNVMPAFVFPDVEGVYRMVWFQAYAAYDTVSGEPGEPLPLEQRVSNAFVLLR